MKQKRRYTLKRRAELQAETRARIVDAAIQLHEQVGPRFTTISAIAERAGVERLTVYRHFPDDESIFNACTGRWLELNPPPDPRTWEGIANSRRRTSAALLALYSYFHRTEGMWTSAYRDLPETPALQRPMKMVDEYLESIAGDLCDAWNPPKGARGRLRSALAHSVQFQTWKSLKGQSMQDADIVRILILWFAAIRRDIG